MLPCLIACLLLTAVTAAPAPAPSATLSGSPAAGPDASVPRIPADAGGPVAAPSTFSGPTCVFTLMGTFKTIGSPAAAPSVTASSVGSGSGTLTAANISCTGGTLSVTGGTAFRPFSSNFKGETDQQSYHKRNHLFEDAHVRDLLALLSGA